MTKLYPHQEKALRRLSNGSVLMGGVGSGKSMVALEYGKQVARKKPIYVITTPKKRDNQDWYIEAAKCRLNKRAEGEGAELLLVDSWNNIKKYIDVKDAFFIFDEQRLVGTGVWAKAFLKIAQKNAWILLSATPGDSWEEYATLFVANGFFENYTEYRTRHFVYSYYGGYPQLVRVLDEPQLEKLRQKIIVDMPFRRKTERHHIWVEAEYDDSTYVKTMKERKDPETGEPFQNASGLVQCLRRIAGSDPSRMLAVRNIIAKHARVIIFYNYNYELEALRRLRDDDIDVYELNGHRHDELPDTKAWVYLVQYHAGAEAWNCTTSDAMIFYSLPYSYKQYEQAQGRIDRLNTLYEDLYYYNLTSQSAVDKGVRKALESKEDFNEKAWILAKENRGETVDQ